MKKTIYTLALGALLLAGCSQEESLATGEEVKVTFTANISNGVQSRADGEPVVNVDKLICAVYKQTGAGDQATLGAMLIKETVDVDVNTGKATFTPTLLKGHKYGVVFWAYCSGVDESDRVFSGVLGENDNLSAITFSTTQSNDVRAYEVYTATKYNVATDITDEALNVKLARPLAQVNIATTLSDWTYVTETLQEDPSKSTMTLAGCCNVYNALNTSYSGTATYTYNTTLASNNKLEGTEKVLLGTGYAFPGSNAECSLSVKNASDAVVYSLNVPGVPTSANYRTNILPKTETVDGEEQGGLMTGSVSYTVTIEPGYGTNENKEL